MDHLSKNNEISMKCYQSLFNPNSFMLTSPNGCIQVKKSGTVYTIDVFPYTYRDTHKIFRECDFATFNQFLDEATSVLVGILASVSIQFKRQSFIKGNGLRALLPDANRFTA